MIDALKSIDAIPKAHDDYRVKTTSGAIGENKIFVLLSLLSF